MRTRLRSHDSSGHAQEDPSGEPSVLVEALTVTFDPTRWNDGNPAGETAEQGDRVGAILASARP
jgi:hypothetical protein